MAEEKTQEQELLANHKAVFMEDHNHHRDWREKARNCYRFESGRQWEDADIAALDTQKRPHITINKIRPVINMVAGFQRLNPYEPQFKPRTADDLKDAETALGITKYVFDDTIYNYEEGRAFLDSVICGRGVFHPTVEWDFESLEADIRVKRVSPFDVYPDRESQDPFWRDAEHVHYARWVTRENLIGVFPEAKNEIKDIMYGYDSIEDDVVTSEQTLFYDRTTKKVRLFETWYKEHYVEHVYIMPDKTAIPADEMPDELKETAIGSVRIPLHRIRVSSWINGLLLEDAESPFNHRMLPFVPLPGYMTGEEGQYGPDGLVADLIDPQKEINKRRSQALHVVNTMANRGWKSPLGSLDEKNKRLLKEQGSTPGVLLEYMPQQGHGLEQFGNEGVPMGLVKLEDISRSDIQDISGVNEAFMAAHLPANTSGRALEIRNRQAITGIARIFDNLRIAKLLVIRQLWGKPGRPGLIPQYFTDEKAIRITGDAIGQDQFVVINQPQFNEFGEQVGVLNDLSKWEFDIVISEIPAMTTQRERQFQQLLEVAGAGVPIPPDVLIESSDLPGKERIMQRLMQQMQPPPGQGPSPPKVPGLEQIANAQAQRGF